MQVMVKKGRETSIINDPVLARSLKRGFEIQSQMGKFRKEISDIKSHIGTVASEHIDQAGTVNFFCGGVAVRVTFGYECVLPEENVAKVMEEVGERYEDLVVEKTTRRGTAKLIDMAADADRGKRLASLLLIREKSPSIAFTFNEKKAAA